MSWRFTLTSLIVWVMAAFGAQAQTLESAVMPGAVIRGHADLETNCATCHVRFDRAAQTRLCLDCHKPVRADIGAGTGYHGRSRARERDCRSCHTEHKGRGAKIVALDEKAFNHAETDFELRGKHRPVVCSSCHRAGTIHRKTPTDCQACHREDDAKKGHDGRFGTRCGKCHDERGWKPAVFDHDRDTRYPLLDRHRQVKCNDCHASSPFAEKAPTRCVACHRQDEPHRETLGDKCDRCHSTRGWKTTRFDHDADTHFALRDKHAAAKCAACHKEKGRFDKLQTTCFACHEADDREKGHRGDFGRKCETCHNAKAFKPAIFSHDRQTKFALGGKHASVKCASCHKSALYGKALKSECVACHREQDVHFASYGSDCAKCHGADDWRKIKPDAPLPEGAVSRAPPLIRPGGIP